MKPVYFRISILLNLVFAASLALILTHKHGPQPLLPPIASAAQSPDPIQPPAVDLDVPPPTKQFDWSQLESADYAVYIANLRHIHCPEQTVRDIITADVESVYSAKRRQLGLDESQAGSWSLQEEKQLVAFLLGDTISSALIAGQPAGQQTNAVGRLPSTPEMPMVFQDVDFAALGFNQGQTNAIQNLRDRFMAEIGGADQDPSDPAYRERWDNAQPETDNLLEGMIGSTAFQNYQLSLRGVKFKNGLPEEP